MKHVFGFFLVLASVVVGVAVWQYLFCPQLDFVSPSKFSGNRWYNPYEGTSNNNWVKCNFHAHTKAWGGLTCGNGSPKDLQSTYSELNYGVHCISDYQFISKDFSQDSNYIPAYEHGYNFLKAHQLVIGDAAVTWADFIFPQTRSNKQWVLNHLYPSSKEVVVLNHPQVRTAYTEEDMKFLSGYQCIEVLNPSARSFAIWDAALSAGKPVFITANDDLHNVLNRANSGRFCTWLNLDKVSKKSVVSALKNGRGYGMEIGFRKNEDTNTRRKRIRDDLPTLKSFFIQNDTLFVAFSKPAATIQFVGQEGKAIAANENMSKASYALRHDDTYIRTAATFNDSVKIYLNPVFRYSSYPFAQKGGYVINKSKTLFMRFIGILALMGWLLVLIRYYIRSKEKRSSELDPLLGNAEEPVFVGL